MYVCVYTYTCIYIYTYTYINMYMYIYVYVSLETRWLGADDRVLRGSSGQQYQRLLAHVDGGRGEDINNGEVSNRE